MKRIFALSLTAVLLLSSAVFAEDFDFESLFGDDLFMEIEESTSTTAVEDALLVNEGIEVGGQYHFNVNGSRTYMESLDPSDAFSANLGGQIFLDARPNPDFRVFAKTSLNYNTNFSEDQQEEQDKDPKQVSLRLTELFSDFHHNNQVYFRAGKQNVNWGVGYFFSPADVINVGRIDPTDPDADREGPVALKAHYPIASNNYYLYLLFDGVEKFSDLAVAPKLEYVMGKSEIGLGGFYQTDKVPRVMATISSTVGSFSVFGEGVVSFGSDKSFVEETVPSQENPFGYKLVERDDTIFQVTVGGRRSYTDPDGRFNFSGALQYFYNGEGYTDQEMLKDFRLNEMALGYFFGQKQLSLSDFSFTGRHYVGAMVGWSDMFNSKLSTSALWLANLSDGSGQLTASLSLPALSSIKPSVGVTRSYGEEGTEFGLLGPTTTVFAKVTIGSGSF